MKDKKKWSVISEKIKNRKVGWIKRSESARALRIIAKYKISNAKLSIMIP